MGAVRVGIASKFTGRLCRSVQQVEKMMILSVVLSIGLRLAQDDTEYQSGQHELTNDMIREQAGRSVRYSKSK